MRGAWIRERAGRGRAEPAMGSIEGGCAGHNSPGSWQEVPERFEQRGWGPFTTGDCDFYAISPVAKGPLPSLCVPLPH